MEEFFDRDKAKAIVYLLAEGDNRNMVLVSDDQLLVIQKNKKEYLALANLSLLKSENKKMLFPLILGGIITPFAFLSYFVNLFHPWVHLLSIMSGMFLFYIGWVGKSAFSIVFKNGDELNFYLPEISKNLQAFIGFVNTFLKETNKSGLRDLLFFVVDKKNEFIVQSKNSIMKNQDLFPLFGYTYEQLKNAGTSIYEKKVIAINPIKAGREIKFSFDQKNNEMRPKLEGPVLEDSIVSV